ncbi:DEAD/DEAH box helicase [Streptomyces roseolus]|uniref:DEAD/DEAH box helicase n=1 Tax=Streptomyces roseolus TaxID=67358 RepID=UPI0019A736BA|nr:DEAD/DEAH box helicase [Streptomyces roseolus]GGR56071.1 helicase [Streptomyces roseolus]
MTAAPATVRLREHQAAGLAAIRAWTVRARRRTPRPDGERATYVSATGSGKTYTAASAALRCFPGGRILVMVPTLDLLVQTAEAWRRIGHKAPMVAVCSLDRDEVLDRLGVRTTTNPLRLALWAGRGPVVVLATYASLVDRDAPGGFDGLDGFEGLASDGPAGVRQVRGPLESALAGGPRLYGQRMDGFDLAVVDEAHGTAGDRSRPWAAIHDNHRVPAAFRLYMTATPRILAAPRAGAEEAAIASMESDPDGTYGEWIHELGLAEAIAREILAGFEIDVLEIRDPDPHPVPVPVPVPDPNSDPDSDSDSGAEPDSGAGPGPAEQALRGRRLALLQTALLEHAARHNLKTVMTFHHRVEEAEAFASRLPSTAAELYATEPTLTALADAERMPPSSIDARLYDLDPGRHVPPDRVWSAWLCGDHLVAERREAIRQFANGVDAAGRRVHRAFLASVRVLGEGVDITGERGVEAVCFADTRGSQVELVQNIGRALRPDPDGTAKTARILVPVFLRPDEDPRDMVASASYAPLVAVLNGLRSHSEHLVADLASRGRTRGARTVHVHREAAGRPGAADPRDTGAEPSPLLRFATPRDPATVAAFLRTRVHRPESLVWLEGYQALRRWRADHGIEGLYAVPYDTETALGATGTFPLGRWVHQQRKNLRAGTLEPYRKQRLDDEGMVWEPGDEAWETNLAALRSYHRAHGHLAPRQDARWGGTDRDSIAIGRLVANLRRPGALGKDPERAAARAARLAEIDPDWNCPWPLDWQRLYRVCAGLAADEPDGRLPAIAPGVVFDGDDLGAWLARQHRAWPGLAEEQRRRLALLGVAPPERRAAAHPAPAPTAAFARGIRALAQFTAREGAGAAPARGHVETLVVNGEEHLHKLGVWYANVRQRRARLTAAQRARLTALGVPWA